MLPLNAREISLATGEGNGAETGMTDGVVAIVFVVAVDECFWGFHTESWHGRTSMGAMELETHPRLVWLAGYQNEK